MTQTSRWLPLLVVTVLVVGAGPIVRASQAAKVDVTGAWVFTVESAAGKSNPTVTFKQDGEKLTGQYSSQLMGEAELTGTVKGQAIEFAISASVQGEGRSEVLRDSREQGFNEGHALGRRPRRRNIYRGAEVGLRV